ncbi:hypothetical protein BH23ACT9_BH23ACT9_15190 [soil metagenome]
MIEVRRPQRHAGAIETTTAVDRWQRRRTAAAALRTAAVTVPALVALVVSWAMGALLPTAPSTAARVVWTIATVTAAVLSAVATTRLLRRTVPLAWLLRVDVAFPGEAPSRLAVALRVGRTGSLQRDLLDGRVDGDDREAAERIVELAAAITAHDRGTRGHSERVRGYTRVIGEAMGVSRDDLDKLAWAGLLHDIGKLAVDPDIINKAGRLDEEELAEMRRHPVEGARLAEPLMPWLGEWGRAIGDHHERWDGTGYPAGLAGTHISLGGRIVAVANAFEAMTAQRSYNTPRTLDAARQELVASAGTQFDPDVVRALLAVPLGRLSRIALPSAALGALPGVHGALVRLGESLGLTPALLRGVGLALGGALVVASASLLPPAGVFGIGGSDAPPPVAYGAPTGPLAGPLALGIGATLGGMQGPPGAVAAGAPATGPATGPATADTSVDTSVDTAPDPVPAPPSDPPTGPSPSEDTVAGTPEVPAPPVGPAPPVPPGQPAAPPPPASTSASSGPGPTAPVLAPVAETVEDVGGAVDEVLGGVGDAVESVVEVLPPVAAAVTDVTDALASVTEALPLPPAVSASVGGVADTVGGVTGDVVDGVVGVADTVTGTVSGLTGGLLGGG